MNTQLPRRRARRVRCCPMRRAASGLSADATCPKRWCRPSIGCRPASTAICTATISRRSSRTSCVPGSAVRPRCPLRRTLSKRWGAEVWLKREDLAHTGAHKINNAIGQTLLAQASRRQAHHRRDGRRPAWRRERRGRGAPRPALRRLHGRGRRGAPGAERRPHAIAGCHGGAGHERRPDAARGDR